MIALALAMAAAQPHWTFEKVDRSANGNRQLTLKLDHAGKVHVIYTGCSDAACKLDELTHSVRDGGAWSRESVDTDKKGTGWSASMDIDEKDTLHVAYANHYKVPTLHYATKPAGGAWKTVKVGPTSGGYWTSIIANAGRVLVSNTAFPTNQIIEPSLQFADLSGGAWNFQTLDNGQDAGWFTSMALDRQGEPMISYVTTSYPNGDLNLITRKNGQWEKIQIDEESVKSSLAVDPAGFIHLVYTKQDPKYLKTMDLWHATNATPDGSWKTEVVEGGEYSEADTGYHPHLSIDARGGLHATYSDRFHTKLMYARNLGDGWKIFPVTKTWSDGYYAWTEIDREGAIHLAYDTGDTIMYARCEECAR